MIFLQRRANQNGFTKVSKIEKNYIDKTEVEKPLVISNPLINKPIYFNISGCGKKLQQA